MKKNKKQYVKALKSLLFASVCVVGLSACASNQTSPDMNYSDPLEPVNRTVFQFNDALDQVVARPVTKGYIAAVPKPARTGIRNFLRNLRSPVNIANQALQGDVDGFANDTMRMLVNTTFGIGGLIDVADSAGLKYEYEDFGQTMGVWGVGHGPYIVLPILGPNSLRDHAGMAVDAYADPLRLYLFNTDQENWYYGRVVMTGIDKRAELMDTLDDLRANSLDYYAALRSAHYQYRQALTRDQGNGEMSVAPVIPDYDEEE